MNWRQPWIICGCSTVGLFCISPLPCNAEAHGHLVHWPIRVPRKIHCPTVELTPFHRNKTPWIHSLAGITFKMNIGTASMISLRGEWINQVSVWGENQSMWMIVLQYMYIFVRVMNHCSMRRSQTWTLVFWWTRIVSCSWNIALYLQVFNHHCHVLSLFIQVHPKQGFWPWKHSQTTSLQAGQKKKYIYIYTRYY